MAEKRMLAKTIIDSDAFLDMPPSTQNLYFHLSMRADDDGFVNNPKRIQRMVNASDDELKLLCVRKFLIPFESGIVVIKHWRIHNYIAKDRYHETKYKNEKATLTLDENGAYTTRIQDVYKPSTECIQDDNKLSTQIRLDKISIDKDSNTKSVPHFQKPELSEVYAYCKERKNKVNAQTFISFYESKGWMIGKNKMKDWKAAVRTWEQKQIEAPKPSNKQGYIPNREKWMPDTSVPERLPE